MENEPVLYILLFCSVLALVCALVVVIMAAAQAPAGSEAREFYEACKYHLDPWFWLEDKPSNRTYIMGVDLAAKRDKPDTAAIVIYRGGKTPDLNGEVVEIWKLEQFQKHLREKAAGK